MVVESLQNQELLYLLSLARGPLPLTKLAEALNIPRPNVYRVIADLEASGLATFTERSKGRKVFTVEPPTTVTSLLRKKRARIHAYDERVTQAMPDLLALYQQGDLPTNVRIFQGNDQFLQIFFQLLEETKESCFLGSAKDFIAFISWAEERRWIKERIKHNLRLKVLLLPSDDTDELKKTDAEELRETRVLKGEAPFVTLYQVYANKVLLWQPKTPIVVLIEDEYIATMMKSLFDVLWERAEK